MSWILTTAIHTSISPLRSLKITIYVPGFSLSFDVVVLPFTSPSQTDLFLSPLKSLFWCDDVKPSNSRLSPNNFNTFAVVPSQCEQKRKKQIGNIHLSAITHSKWSLLVTWIKSETIVIENWLRGISTFFFFLIIPRQSAMQLS